MDRIVKTIREHSSVVEDIVIRLSCAFGVNVR